MYDLPFLLVKNKSLQFIGYVSIYASCNFLEFYAWIQHRAFGVFDNVPGDRGSIPGRVI